MFLHLFLVNSNFDLCRNDGIHNIQEYASEIEFQFCNCYDVLICLTNG